MTKIIQSNPVSSKTLELLRQKICVSVLLIRGSSLSKMPQVRLKLIISLKLLRFGPLLLFWLKDLGLEVLDYPFTNT